MSSPKIKPTKRGANIKGLVPRMRMFVEHLMADESFNATNAAKKAGYANPGRRATKLLQDPRVRAALGKGLQERIKRCQLTADAVLSQLETALFLDPLDLFESTDDGTFQVRSLEDIPQEVRRCITKIKQRTRMVGETAETYIEVELMSKDAALQAAMKHFQLGGGDNVTNINAVGVDLSALLDQVENDRSTVDGSVIKRLAKGK